MFNLAAKSHCVLYTKKHGFSSEFRCPNLVGVLCINNYGKMYISVDNAHLDNLWFISTVFANGPGDVGSIPGRVIPKTQKIILDADLINSHYYKVRIKGKVEQSKEGSSALPNTSM